MNIYVLQTGYTLVSSAVPDRSTHRMPAAYTGLFQKRSRRISIPVKAFLIETAGHRGTVKEALQYWRRGIPDMRRSSAMIPTTDIPVRIRRCPVRSMTKKI